MIRTPKSLLKRYKIGNTPLTKYPKIEELYGIPRLLIKDESRNPFGTFKDRRNKLVLDKAMKAHVDKLVLITSGNTGYSLARLAKGTGIKVICVVDNGTNPQIKEQLRKYSHRVIEVDLMKDVLHEEDVIKLAREIIGEVIWDVTNTYHEGFKEIIKEIKKENPDWLITPLGAGEAYVGLYEGLKKYRMKTKLVGVGVHKLQGCELELRERPSIADKLYTPYTPYKKTIEAILKEGHIYIPVSDEEIHDAYKKVSPIISCEPSSAAAFAALPKLNIKKDSKVVVINSGKGIWGNANNYKLALT